MSITATVIHDQIEALRSRGEEFCVATVVRTADATSAKAGAKAVVTQDGLISGFVGGGCVQGSVRKAAADALKSGEGQTLAVYMGVKNAPRISAGLINEGVAPGTPVAVVENGTRANERRFYGTLKTLPELVSENAG